MVTLDLYFLIRSCDEELHRKEKELDVDYAIAEVLQLAPHRPGGSMYKVYLCKKKNTK
jgi:hypothetical protein